MLSQLNHNRQQGFALPTVLIVVVILMIVGLTMVQSVSSIQTSLDDQYYDRLAREAAESGIAVANHCLGQNAFSQTWGPAASKPVLTQTTDCTGGNRSPAVASLLQGGNVRSTFSVGDLEARDDGALIIASQGKVEVLRGSTGTVARTYTRTLKQLVDYKQFKATKSASGTHHTCSIVNNEVYCWGRNNFGQLGNGQTAPNVTPIINPEQVLKEPGLLEGKIVTDIFSAQFHNCALADGKVYCWGRNDTGQLGNPVVTDDSNKPVLVGGALDGKYVTDIGGAGDSSCAIAEGKIYCWGNNFLGTVGDGTAINRNTPTSVSIANLGEDYNATTLSTSGSRSFNMCAIIDSKAWCWGPNEAGQIGNGTVDTTRHEDGWGNNPVRVPTKVTDTGQLAGKTVTAISQDGNFDGLNPSVAANEAFPHVCVVADYRVYCWGENVDGQLGRNNTTDSNVPVATVGALATDNKVVQDVAVGINHSCALANSKVYCWGKDQYGQLGDGNNNGTDRSITPNLVAELPGGLAGKTVTAIGGGANRGCAIANFRSYCWGLNTDGQLGDGTTENKNVPTPASFMEPQAPSFIF